MHERISASCFKTTDFRVKQNVLISVNNTKRDMSFDSEGHIPFSYIEVCRPIYFDEALVRATRHEKWV